MTKRASEAAFGLALRNVDLDVEVYKPSDMDMNMKPCDFMVWIPRGYENDRAWFEVKDVDTLDRFSFRNVRKSQWNAMRRARRLGIPYWLAIYWRRRRLWTISDTGKLLDMIEGKDDTWTSFVLLHTRLGIDSEPANLVSTLKSVLLGEV